MNNIIYKVNDTVWTSFGYAIIQDLGQNRKQIEIFQKKSEQKQQDDIQQIEENKQINEDQKQTNGQEDMKQNNNGKEELKDNIDHQQVSEKKEQQNQNSENENEKQQKEITNKHDVENNNQNKEKDNNENKSQEQEEEHKENIEQKQQKDIIIQEKQSQQQQTQQKKNQEQEFYYDEEEQERLLNQIVKLKLKKGDAQLYIPLRNLQKHITIYVKTFFGNREKFTLENIDISLPIQHLKKLIIQKSGHDDKSFYNKRLIYPMSQIQILSDDHNLQIYQIPDQANLVLMVSLSFFWDSNFKGSTLQLSNNNLTVKKLPETECQVVLGNLPLVSGKCYFEIKIQQFQQLEDDGDDLIIGVARKDISLNQPYYNTKPGLIWGYLPLRAEKVGPEHNLIPFGHKCKKGDIVGVLLEFKSGIGSLSFYKNKEKCNNPGFTNLTGTFYPAIAFPFGEFQITLYPQASIPLNL